MIETTANLVVDFGNSETRVITQVMGSKQREGKDPVKSRFAKLSNRYAGVESIEEIPEAYLRKEEDRGYLEDINLEQEDRTYIFDYNGSIFAVGKYVERERGRDVIRPSSLEKKYTSITTELAMRMALIEGYESLAEMLDTFEDNLEVKWNVTVLIPPADIDYGAEQLTEKIKGIKELVSYNPEIKTKIQIESVKVLAEGFASFLGVLFNQEGKGRKDYLGLAKTTTLIIDVGAGTTDYSLIKNAEPIDDMKDTVTIGGNNVVQTVRKELRARGITTTDEEIQEAVKTGYISDGANKIDLVESLNEAKSRIARDIVNSIRDYFEYGSIPARGVNNLLVVGGGSLNTVNGSKPISEFLVEYFRSLSPNVELVEIPNGGEGENVPVNPRNLNVIGASIVSRRTL